MLRFAPFLIELILVLYCLIDAIQTPDAEVRHLPKWGWLVLILLIARGGVGGLGQIGRAPWWALVGGLLGAVYVSVALVAVRTLGASGLTAVVIGGQLAISVVIDRFGLLGVAKQAVGAQRILGLALLAVGVALVVRK